MKGSYMANLSTFPEFISTRHLKPLFSLLGRRRGYKTCKGNRYNCTILFFDVAKKDDEQKLKTAK